MTPQTKQECGRSIAFFYLLYSWNAYPKGHVIRLKYETKTVYRWDDSKNIGIYMESSVTGIWIQNKHKNDNEDELGAKEKLQSARRRESLPR
jgi:hypothetical protein